MMGQQSAGQEQLFYSFNLEDHVPGNHLLRGVDCHLDLSNLHRELLFCLLLCIMLRSSGSECKELGKVDFADLNGGYHHSVPESCGAPAMRTGDLGDQAMGVETVQDPAHLGALALGVTALRCAMGVSPPRPRSTLFS